MSSSMYVSMSVTVSVPVIITMDTQHENAAWAWVCSIGTMGIGMQHGHRHAVRERVCSKDMTKQHGHKHLATWTRTCSSVTDMFIFMFIFVLMFMQHGQTAWTRSMGMQHGHTAWIPRWAWACTMGIMGIGMQHGHGHAVRAWALVMQQGHGQAAWTKHGQGHAARTWTFSMDITMEVRWFNGGAPDCDAVVPVQNRLIPSSRQTLSVPRWVATRMAQYFVLAFWGSRCTKKHWTSTRKIAAWTCTSRMALTRAWTEKFIDYYWTSTGCNFTKVYS